MMEVLCCIGELLYMVVALDGDSELSRLYARIVLLITLDHSKGRLSKIESSSITVYAYLISVGVE